MNLCLKISRFCSISSIILFIGMPTFAQSFANTKEEILFEKNPFQCFRSVSMTWPQENCILHDNFEAQRNQKLNAIQNQELLDSGNHFCAIAIGTKILLNEKMQTKFLSSILSSSFSLPEETLGNFDRLRRLGCNIEPIGTTTNSEVRGELVVTANCQKTVAGVQMSSLSDGLILESSNFVEKYRLVCIGGPALLEGMSKSAVYKHLANYGISAIEPK